jgi:proteasome lid subunit RPN8/RPN11
MSLILSNAHRRQIEAQARAAFPGECCGLIEGTRQGGVFHAIVLHPARNLAAARDRFEIDPVDQFQALRAARAAGHDVIGCYHSHPHGAAKPSARDKDGAGEEDFIWLIAALDAAGPVRLAAFCYSGGDFTGLDLRDMDGADLVTSSLKVPS